MIRWIIVLLLGTSAALALPRGSGSPDPTVGVLPSYNDVYANWKNAGLLSVGGIPARSTVCATVSPSGLTPPQSGDDVALINAAIAACPAGEVVQLSAGTFNLDIPSSEFIFLDKGVTLRGTGTCSASVSITSAASTTVSAGPYYTPLCQTIITSANGLIHNNASGKCGTSQSATNSCGNNWPLIFMAPSAIGNPWGWAMSDCSRSTWLLDSTCGATIPALTADATQGTTSVQVNTTAGLSVGQFVLITEASGAQWVTDPVTARGGSIWAPSDMVSSSGSPASGRVGWASWDPYPGYGDFDYVSGQYPYASGNFATAWGLADRVTDEIHLITAIGSGPCPCTVTFDDPLTVAYRQSGGAQFTGVISSASGTTATLTASGVTGTISVRAPLTDLTSTVSGGTYISAFGTGSGGAGTYTITCPANCANESSRAMAAAGYAAKIVFLTSNASATPVSYLQYAGVENLSVTRGPGGEIQMLGCAYCWAKNIDASQLASGAVEMIASVRVQVDTVFGHDCWNDTSNGTEYPLDFTWGTTEVYIVNSMTRACGKSMAARAGGAGSVVAYNYFDDLYYGYNSGLDFYLIDASLNGSHLSGPHNILFEGNWAVNMLDDHAHGNSVYHVYFRNYVNGYRTPFTDVATSTLVNDYTNTPGTPGNNGPFNAAEPTAYAYWHAYVANVLGNATYSIGSNGWNYQSGTGSESSKNIFDLGPDDATSSYDTNMSGVAGSYYFRHGNYDSVTTSVHWNSGYSDHNLPNSFYSTSTPSSFAPTANCTYPWPWVTPTLGTQLQPATGSSCTADSGLPAKARYDAGTPFVQP